MSNIFSKAGDKISSLFSFMKFNWEYYHTLNLKGQMEYLTMNRNKLSKEEYTKILNKLLNKINEQEEIKKRDEVLRKEAEFRRKRERESLARQKSFGVNTNNWTQWDIETGYPAYKSSQLPQGYSDPFQFQHVYRNNDKGRYMKSERVGVQYLRNKIGPVLENSNMKMNAFEQIEMLKKEFKDGSYKPNRNVKITMDELQTSEMLKAFQQKQGVKHVTIMNHENREVEIPVYDESNLIDIEQYVFNDVKQWEYYRQARENKLLRLSRQQEIEEMNEGCILLITETGAALSPLIDQLNPNQFRYRMIINRFSKVNNLDEYKKTLKEAFPFIHDNQITFSNKVEEYFPLDLTKDYNAKYAAKWLFIKNVSEESILVYLRFPQDPAYNDRSFVSVKPGGIISLLYGNMINCKNYNTDIRVPDDHEFMQQYEDKTHPLINNGSWE